MYNLIVKYSWMKSKIYIFMYDPLMSHKVLMDIIPENFIVVSKSENHLRAINADGDSIRLEVETFV